MWFGVVPSWKLFYDLYDKKKYERIVSFNIIMMDIMLYESYEDNEHFWEFKFHHNDRCVNPAFITSALIQWMKGPEWWGSPKEIAKTRHFYLIANSLRSCFRARSRTPHPLAFGFGVVAGDSLIETLSSRCSFVLTMLKLNSFCSDVIVDRTEKYHDYNISKQIYLWV